MVNPVYSAEALDNVQKMLLEGKSYSDIAKFLGVTRSSVAGLVYRNKFRKPDKVVKVVNTKATKRKNKHTTRRTPSKPPERAYQRPKGENLLHPTYSGKSVDMEHLEGGMCKWPVKRVGMKHLFCGGNIEEGNSSYCALHRKIGVLHGE